MKENRKPFKFVRIKIEIYSRLETLAKSNDRTVTAEINRALRKHLDVNKAVSKQLEGNS